MTAHTFQIHIGFGSLQFHNKSESREGHYPILYRVLNFMKDRGFEVGRDPQIEELYISISKDFWYGRKKDLEFKAHRYPAGFEIHFYQNVVFENRHGGYYDFDKYSKMPYLIKLQFRNEVNHIASFLEELECVNNSKPVYKTAADSIKQHYVESWHHPQKSMDEFDLKDIDGQTAEGSYNRRDKDDNTIYNGEIKYFRDRKGRLMRGKVYHNINNMWWVILNALEYTNLADFELFYLTPENSAKKVIRRSGHNNPKARWMPSIEEYKAWKEEMEAAGKEGRIEAANRFLEYLYSIDWMSRCFQFVLKANGRLGLVETKGAPNYSIFSIPRKETTFDPPKKIPLYPKPSHMSGTESGWVENLRNYVVHGPGPRVSAWFCRDRNGEGNGAYLWPEVREKLIKMGAMVINIAS